MYVHNAVKKIFFKGKIFVVGKKKILKGKYVLLVKGIQAMCVEELSLL